MADIKFMNLSENDNPATTDSVLIGNQENGLKRTTLGKIGDMFAVKGLLHYERVNQPLKNGKVSDYTINAPSVDGYKFAFWLTLSTAGKTNAGYIEDVLNPATTAHILNPENDDLTTGDSYFPTPSVTAVAVYFKSSVA